MEARESNVSGTDWVADQITAARSLAASDRPVGLFGFQGWGPAALFLGIAEILLSGIAHVISWLYVSLAWNNMSDTDTRLGLAVSITYALVTVALGIVGVVAGILGVRESRRLNFARGISFVGLVTACAGLLFWLLASTNLLIVAIARLR